MRAKIIADLTVIFIASMIIVFWMINMPPPDPLANQTAVQEGSVVLAIVSVWGSVTYMASKIISWIHRG